MAGERAAKVLRATSAPFYCSNSIYRKVLYERDSKEGIFYGTAFVGWVSVRFLPELRDALRAAHAYRAILV